MAVHVFKLRLLVHFDAIFDTVFGTLRTMDPSLTLGLNDTSYHDRYHNVLSDFDSSINLEEFRERFAKRDLEVLKNSFVNRIPVWLSTNIARYQGMDEQHPDYREVHLTFNYWPYELSPELIEAFKVQLGNIMFIEESTIHFVSLPLDKLSPAFLKQRYDHLILWDFHEWEKLFIDELINCPITDVGITAPLIVHDLQRHEAKEHLSDLAEIARKVYSSSLHLELLPLKYFSYIKP